MFAQKNTFISRGTVLLCVLLRIDLVCALTYESFMEEWGDCSCERRKQHLVVAPETGE